MSFPVELRTARLRLRPWRGDDAVGLHPILEINREHLGPWIPARVADPATIPELTTRLNGFAANFAADREWRFGMFSPDEREVFGEIGVFPRNAAGRVAFADADRAELGYWLRVDQTGRGIVTEAARAVLDVVHAVPQFSHVEIRCDARNEASVAVARRLGFELATSGTDDFMQVWISKHS
jgi:ribosomal-protein-serine acetyltransferase